MNKILKSYLKRLTNLTVSNRSLFLPRLSREQDLDLHELDFINGKPSFTFIESLISGKKEISFCPVSDSRNAAVNACSGNIRKISRREKFLFEERGAKDLYVGWPFVCGKFSDDTPVRCPLLFFPVTLEQNENNWLLKQREDVPVAFNKSFLLAYAYYQQVNLSDDFMDTSFEDFDKDSQVFRTQLYALLKESPLEINFNQDLFVNKLQPFENVKKADFEERYGGGEIQLMPHAVLGIFPQAGSYLVPDYDFLIKNNFIPDLEEFFLKRSNEPETVVKEEHIITPFPLDASQEKCILDLKKGKSLVVQGPPGTGKSQLICNLVADFIARGKNVLVVCQKRAALDVVYERLRKKGLGDFIALVHDFKNDRRQIYEQIHSQIERIEEFKFKNNSLDAIFLERSYVQASRRIEQLTEELEEFKKALFDEREAGVSIKELYLTTDPSAPVVNVKQEHRYFRAAEIMRFSAALRRLLPYATKFEKSDYLWNDRVSFAGFTLSDKKKLLTLLDHIPFFQSEASEKIHEILGTSLEMEDFEWLLDRQESIGQMLHLLEDPSTYSYFCFFLNKNTDTNWFIIREKKIMECFKGSGMETSLSREQLGDLQKALDTARLARKSLIKWIRWKLFGKEKFFLKRVCVQNKLEFTGEGLEELEQRVDNRMNFEHNLTELRQCGWLQDVPDTGDLRAISDWIHHQQTALGAKAILKELRNLKDYLNIPSLSFFELKSKLTSLVRILSEIPPEKKRWLEYLTQRQVIKILNAFDLSIDLGQALQEDFESLVEYDRLKESLTAPEKSVFERLLKTHPGLDPEKLIRIFENSVRLEWIESIEMKYPVLRAVASLKMDQMERELQECVQEKQRLSTEILQMKVRERAYADIEYNRLDNMITYRELKHQTSKKRNIWPIRKLLAAHGREVSKLVPCWLASPESVSSIFPMEIIFDLVIFDEASQCYAENAIPAMYRAQQVLIAGDSKQLHPSDLYAVRWEEEDDTLPELEIDSLLDLGKNYLKEESLRGHYRSKSLDLIEFSNLHFYKGNLQALPDLQEINKKEPAIRFIKVNGIWENNCNLVEAEEVVRIIKGLRKEDPLKTIGVVAFNFRQQMLVQDLLEEEGVSADPELLFVKNIENVQGDERDSIIFTIAYAPDKKGRMNMHFGSLNMEKGENRLNVAVTRAKEKVYVVSSIVPDQLDVTSSKHPGPKLFKEYLAYAMQVSSGAFKPSLPLKENKSPDWFLKNLLMKHVYPFEMAEELPFTDLTVKSYNQYKGLVETDDDMYFRSLSAKEVHAYLPLALSEKNWRYKRIFSRVYWENSEKVFEGLVKTFGQ